MNELALFAGAGGGILGGKLLGWKTVCAVEWGRTQREILHDRQDDKALATFPIWDDVQTFNGRQWRGIVDVVSGGFPCQDISCAGKGCGIEGKRSGMWFHMARIISEVQPNFALVENSPMLTLRGLDRVLGDLAEMGFDARWGVFSAADAGARHERERIWIVADSTGKFKLNHQLRKTYSSFKGHKKSWQEPSLESLGDVDGMADRVGSQLAIGNGQVPAVVRLAWETLCPD